jgi:hypothetical protein
VKVKAEGKNIIIPAVKYNTIIFPTTFSLLTETTKHTTPRKNRHSRHFDVVVGENEKPIIVDEARIGTLQERLEGLCRLAQCRWPNLKHLETWNATDLYSATIQKQKRCTSCNRG